MPTKFFTNEGDNSLFRKFQGVLTYVPHLHHFDALVGYFRSSGYFKLREHLDNIPKIRILVGINVDQLTKQFHDRGQQFIDSPQTTRDAFVEALAKDIQEAHYSAEVEKGMKQFIADLLSKKIEMRAHPTRKLHAKIYLFRPVDYNEHTPCEVITGSSNLTDAGMGTIQTSNYEFNVSLRDYEDVKFATDEFERLWKDSVPILEADAKAIQQQTYLRDNFTPYELYIKMLMEYFGKRVEYDPYNIDLLLPPAYKRLKYQSDAANQGYAIMMKHNGFILADVVGLGKTIVACMVIKKFIYENGTHTRVLVVVPPALESAWKRTATEFQIATHFHFITLGSLAKVLNENNADYASPDRYDMVVVDESHKFRNHDTNMYKDLQEICKRPRSRPAENGDSRKKVILISATPLNNRPKDIENQLYLFQDRRNSTLEKIRNLEDYFRRINDRYQVLASEEELDIPRLKALFQELRDDVIAQLVIRRTRTDIERSQIYREDLAAQGIAFPQVGDPIEVKYTLDTATARLFFDTISLITGIDEAGQKVDGLGYYRYRAIEFLQNEEDQKIYGNVKSISDRLEGIMKVLLVKRLESSFHAFRQSLGRLQTAINNMLAMFEDGQVYIAPDLDVNKLIADGRSEDEIVALIENRGGNNRVFAAADFKAEFIDLLLLDKARIDDLAARWALLTKDPKLAEFTRWIDEEWFDAAKNPSGKLVIFTESKETATELVQALAEKGKHKVLAVSADNRKDVEKRLRDNFDANLDKDRWQHDCDIVITTEVLAEGINLHRSNVIINYDVPWNATRLMQRIGRVNRIGSEAARIYVYNFFPSAHGDEQIRLVNNALRKLQSFHTAFGEDNRIFTLMEEKGEGGLFNPKTQEEESEFVKYLEELRQFRKAHPKWYKEIAAMPHKARCGRAATSVTDLPADVPPLAQSSLCYLKSDTHPGAFCLVTPEQAAVELSFLQAVKIFHASENEKPLPLPDGHHQQAQTAVQQFVASQTRERVRTVPRVALSNTENTAINNLNAVKNWMPTDQKRTELLRAIDLIKNGTVAALPKAVITFFKANKGLNDTTAFAEKLVSEVLDRFHAPAEPAAEPTPIAAPHIVLAQSFV